MEEKKIIIKSFKNPVGGGLGLPQPREVGRSFSASADLRGLARSHPAGAAQPSPPAHSSAPRLNLPSARGNESVCLDRLVFLRNATMEMVNLFLPIPSFFFFFF